MISLGAFTTSTINNFKDRSWTLGDQLISFSCPFASSTISTASFMEPDIIPLALTNEILKSGHVFQGNDITMSLLNQALEYFQKALCNFNSQYLLAQRGYSTWATVTNYYSSYFSIFGLLSLQGRAITRIKLNGINEITCLLHPIDFRNHRYVLTTTDNRDSSHKLPWSKYYNIYNNYTTLKPEFEIVQQKRFVTEPFDESDARNTVNYKSFYGFQEIIDIAQLNNFKTLYLDALTSPALGDVLQNYLITLYGLATDPELKYFARSAIRLILMKTLFDEIGNINAHFKAEFISRIPTWQNTMFDDYNPPRNYYEDFINVFLT